MDSVKHIEIRDEEAISECVKYFPNVTELELGTLLFYQK